MNQIMNQTNETEVDVLAIHEHVVFNPTEEAPAVTRDVPPVPEAEEKIFKLTRPLNVNGVMTDKLCLDFDALSVADLMNIEQEMLAAGITVLKNPAFSETYSFYVAARAAGVNIDDLKNLHIKDGSRLSRRVANFLSALE